MSSQVTVRQLADVLGLEVDVLLRQFAGAGIDITDPDAGVSNTQKQKLLDFLRKSHGKLESAGPRKVTLKRKTVSELRVPGAAGRTKTVNVEVRQKRTYVKRSVVAEQHTDDPDREAAQKALEATRMEREKEENERLAAERAREEAEQAERDAEARRIQEQEAQARAEAEAIAKAEAEEKARIEAEERSKREAEERERAVAEQKERAERATREAEAKAQEKKPAPAPDRKKKGRTDNRRGPRDGQNTRYGRAELHVVGEHAARRKGRRQRKSSLSTLDQHGFSRPTAPVIKEIALPEAIVVSDLAQRMSVKSTEVIKELMKLGIMATINQTIDRDTATLVVEEMGHSAVDESPDDVEAELLVEAAQARSAEDGDEVRPPVVTIMGHVDHGKTSLLDYIRKSRVAAGEAGGITQHIGAYHVETDKGVISFLDTPGHAAFTAMRARGAKVTDIVVLVVAADDGVMPQTIEAINHARAAETPLIVAVNKIDKENADLERAKSELAQHEVIPEDWGGEEIFVPVSALTGEGVEELLDAISLQAEVMELRANPNTLASGVVVEASLDRGRGAVATVLVQNGTLKQGDFILCGEVSGRVRAMFDERGEKIDTAGPSIPAQVLGLSATPNAGDDMLAVENERRAKEVAEKRQEKERETRLAQQHSAKLQNLFSQMGSEERLLVTLVIKADVHGSAEALRDALVSLTNDEIEVRVISSGVGGITESDATLAQASGAIMIGFNVRADASARRIIKDGDLDMRYYSVIYDALDDVKKAVAGVLGTETKEQIVGLAEVKDVFRSSKIGAIAGCIVVEGVVRQSNPIRVLRDNVVVFEGELESLRRFKDQVAEVKSGTECGIGVKQYNDIKPGDQVECFERIEVARTL
ncbi:MAG: hypothetical protein DHS20C11_17680 [Lysobacteraceae bacterium]|nr:MAG: hypothetical protein DHS20C11_17680 [Xanthomonadaceae bacterium]